jgi:tetratricopeptide (TPR) repeat protein
MPKPPRPPSPSSPDEPLNESGEFPEIPPTIPAGRPPAAPPLEGLAASELRRPPGKSRRGPPADGEADPSWFANKTEEEIPEVSQFEQISTTEARRLDSNERDRAPRRSWGPILKVGGAALAVVAILAVVFVLQSRRRKQAVEVGLDRAELALASDTASGYREAAKLLEPLTDIDPINAGSMRAFACAMLAADYRDEGLSETAKLLLVRPGRAPEVPPYAYLAEAALALQGKEEGTAAVVRYASHAPGPWSDVLSARVAVSAGNLAEALKLLDEALAQRTKMVAALALRGDVLRRQRQYDPARASYLAALELSPLHPRAAYGLAKLALAGHLHPSGARTPLEKILEDRVGTPDAERRRAALHLAALLARVKDPARATAAIDAAQLAPPDRAWLERAVAREELDQIGYHAVEGAPLSLQSASDDDPPEAVPAQPRPAVAPTGTKGAPVAQVKKFAPPRKQTPARKHAKATGSGSKSGSKSSSKSGTSKSSAAKKKASTKKKADRRQD